jgi:KipI family sensor histidine kinase inhibitor
MSEVVLRPAGDRAVLIEVADPAAAATVARRLRAECAALVDVVPGHCTVLAIWGDNEPADLAAIAANALMDDPPEIPSPTIAIPVTYDGPDLVTVSELAGLSVDDVVAVHTDALYTVGFIGFAPGFAYLIGGDERLHVPRRSEPRTHVPAGSVGVAGPYSGVYPREGPGGWQLIGRTSFELFDPARKPPSALTPGDSVRFVAE